MRLLRFQLDLNPKGIAEAKVKGLSKSKSGCVLDFIPIPLVFVLKKLIDEKIQERMPEILKNESFKKLLKESK